MRHSKTYCGFFLTLVLFANILKCFYFLSHLQAAVELESVEAENRDFLGKSVTLPYISTLPKGKKDIKDRENILETAKKQSAFSYQSCFS